MDKNRNTTYILLIVILLLIIFWNLQVSRDAGFTDYHRFGKWNKTTSWLSVINRQEARFYFWYFIAGSVLCVMIYTFLTRFQPLIQQTGTLHHLFIKYQRWLAPGISISSMLLIFLINKIALDGAPLTDDEWVYRFQAQIIAHGRLTAPLPAAADFFRNQYVVITDKMYCQYGFGHPAILAIGVLLGLETWISCILGGLTVLLIFQIGACIDSARMGWFSAFLLLCSPQFLLTSGTTASQVSSLFMIGLFLYLLVRGVFRESIKSIFFSGVVAGLALQVRPLDILMSAAPFILLFLPLLFSRDRSKQKIVLGIVAGGIIASCLYLAINWYVNGGPLTTNYNPLWKEHRSGATSAFGFGRYPWDLIHTPAKGVLHTIVNAIRLNFWLFGWHVSWLPIIAALFRKPFPKILKLVVITIPLTFLLYFFYFWPGTTETGPVYHYTLLIPAALITGWVLALPPSQKTNRLRIAPVPILVALSVCSLTLFLPVQLWNLRNIAARINEPYEILKREVTEPALIFTPFYFYVNSTTKSLDRLPSSVMSLRNNSPDLSDRYIFVRDLKERNHELMQLFPQRKAYRFYKLDDHYYGLQALGWNEPVRKVALEEFVIQKR